MLDANARFRLLTVGSWQLAAERKEDWPMQTEEHFDPENRALLCFPFQKVVNKFSSAIVRQLDLKSSPWSRGLLQQTSIWTCSTLCSSMLANGWAAAACATWAIYPR